MAKYAKLIGNHSVGFMQVPEAWANRIDDIDSEFVKNQDAVYYVNSRSEFTSAAKQHFDFSESVEMSRHSNSYEELAQALVSAYEEDATYANTTTSRATMGKRRAFVITSTNTTDNLTVVSIVIDRDNNEKVSVVLSFNAGAASNAELLEQAMAFAGTWQCE